jgi:hypothetical protein
MEDPEGITLKVILPSGRLNVRFDNGRSGNVFIQD